MTQPSMPQRSQQATSPAEPAAYDPAGHVAPTGDVEQIYFEGSPMLRGELMFTTLWVLAGLIVAAAPALLIWLRAVESVPWWAWLVGLVLGAIIVLVPVLRTKRTRYRITNYRIDREIGLLAKKIETLELWHVEDIQFYQSMVDRVLGVGTITVISHDDTTPQLELKSLPKPRPLFDTLKGRIIAVKRQRGVLKLDQGGHGFSPDA